MTLTDIITIIILVLILGVAVGYLIIQNKKGVKCIGCPHANSCSSKNNCSSDKK